MARIGDGLSWAQVWIRPAEGGFDLCHVNDRDQGMSELKSSGIEDARGLGQTTARGAFRPLKSAPTLQRGWHLHVEDAESLEHALNQLYPGSIGDWHAAQAARAPVTHYREFAGRQTGMYRITAMMEDTRAARVAGACCDKGFCLKRRLWTAGELAPDGAEEKSLIPCLEPCAILMEFARKTMRIDQSPRLKLELSAEEAATLAAALEQSLERPAAGRREADFDAPANPRRVRLLLERMRRLAGGDGTGGAK